jgi:hypothetical protein
MVKPISRPYSQYSLNALELLGQLVREARLSKALTTTEKQTSAPWSERSCGGDNF